MARSHRMLVRVDVGDWIGPIFQAHKKVLHVALQRHTLIKFVNRFVKFLVIARTEIFKRLSSNSTATDKHSSFVPAEQNSISFVDFAIFRLVMMMDTDR